MLRFATLTSDIELAFYTSLASLKINHDKLDDSARKLLGLYEIRPTDSPESSCRIQVHSNALTNDEFVAQTTIALCHWTHHEHAAFPRVIIVQKGRSRMSTH